MQRLVTALLVGALLLAACTGDDTAADDGESSGEAVEPIDVDAARERYLEVCERTAADTARCPEVVDEAIDTALETECGASTLDAYFEHAATWAFERLLDDEFFATCPLPLATLMLAQVPDGYTVSLAGDPEVGLMNTRRLGRLFADESVAAWLGQLGHELSYSTHMVDSDGATIAVRLDRFATDRGAIVFVEPDADPDDAEIETITGVVAGRVIATEITTAQGATVSQHQAIGRVCNVAITVFARSPDGPSDGELAKEMFLRQARRTQEVVTC